MSESGHTGLEVTFWGTRGSIPTPGPRTRVYGGNTCCVEIRAGPMLIICDAGTGIRELGLRLEAEARGPIEGHLFMSHTHWDHIQGFPFFTAIYDPANHFFVYEIEGDDQRHHRLLSGQMQSDYFPVAFSDLGARIEPVVLAAGGNDIGEVHVRAFPLPHPGGCYAYSFERNGCKVVYSSDCELDLDLPDLDASIEEPGPLRSVDRRYLDFIAGADLLIVDSQYIDEEYPDKRGWGHARATTAVDAAVSAKVKQLALFHHDPMHSDEDVRRKVAVCQRRVKRHGADVHVFGAREGLHVVLSSPAREAASG